MLFGNLFLRGKNFVQQLTEHYTQRSLYSNIVHLDDAQLQLLIGALSQSIDQASNKAIDDLSKALAQDKSKRNDVFSQVVRVILSCLFVGFGVILLIAIIARWSTIWTGGLQNFAVAIVLIYCAIFIVLGIDIFREKDRNYLITIFSSLVTLGALIVALLE